MEKPLHATDRAAALQALSDDQRKRLAAYARFSSKNTGETHEDLLQAAQLRWLESDKAVEGPGRTVEFLFGAISSVRSNIFRHNAVVRRHEGERVVSTSVDEQDPVELAPDPAVSTEDTFFFQQIYDLCANDPDVQMLLILQADRATRAEIRQELGWDDTKYEAVRKRKIRLIARWKIDGKLA